MPAMERLIGATVGVESKPTLGLSGPDLTLACPGGTEMCLTHSCASERSPWPPGRNIGTGGHFTEPPSFALSGHRATAHRGFMGLERVSGSFPSYTQQAQTALCFHLACPTPTPLSLLT